MKINNNTLTYKINCTRLACKVQCEHTQYTTTLIDGKNMLREKLTSASPCEKRKRGRRRGSTTQPRICCVCKHCFGYKALHLLHCGQSNVCEKQLELQEVSLIPFPHLEKIFFLNHNNTVAVCLSFMFIVDIVCMCIMNLYHCSLLYTTISVCCKFSTFYTSNIFVEKKQP